MARVVDVGEETAVQGFCAAAIDHLGGLDCLINNAGIAGPTLPVEEITPPIERLFKHLPEQSVLFFGARIPSLRQVDASTQPVLGCGQTWVCLSHTLRPQNGGDWPNKITGH